jgi:hypothetical protein
MLQEIYRIKHDDKIRMAKEILNSLELFIFICGLFNDAISSSDYITLKGKISE